LQAFGESRHRCHGFGLEIASGLIRLWRAGFRREFAEQPEGSFHVGISLN
jgi:hypothetical protein